MFAQGKFVFVASSARLNTRDLMTRKFFYIEDSSCVICVEGANEELMHLFLPVISAETSGYDML